MTLPQIAHDAYWRIKETGDPPPFESLPLKLRQCWAAAAEAVAAAERERILGRGTQALDAAMTAIENLGAGGSRTTVRIVLDAAFAAAIAEGDTQ